MDSLSRSSSSDIGDCIGMESGCSMSSIDELSYPIEENDRPAKHCYCNIKRNEKPERKELPPPIPHLARTENLPSHMPWVLKRHYTPDGRLVIFEEKVKHHEYFMAHRENGRLTLQLVPVAVSSDFETPADNAEESDEEIVADDDDEEEDYEEEGETECKSENADVKLLNDSTAKLGCATSDSSEESGNGSGNMKGGKCIEFSSTVGSSSGCLFGLTVPAVRPVHI